MAHTNSFVWGLPTWSREFVEERGEITAPASLRLSPIYLRFDGASTQDYGSAVGLLTPVNVECQSLGGGPDRVPHVHARMGHPQRGSQFVWATRQGAGD